MTITTQDIKLIASKVMADVPEGGGGPSGKVLESGRSNNIFADVRTQDRAGGNLSMRQLHVGVMSGNTSVAMGAHVIVSEPPTDPNVSIVLMETADDFATRATDIARLEAGYVESIAYSGYLFGNHMQGMRNLSIVQRAEAPVPAAGVRLALVWREGFSNKATQFVSIQRVEHSVQQFEDGKGAFERRVVTLTLGQALERDYPGFDPVREGPSMTAINAATRIRSTVWGNAARYYGIQPLQIAGALGDYTVRVPSIYARVVPSAEAETPIADAKPSQQKEMLVQSGGDVSYTVTAAWDTATALYIGGGITPGSLQITRAGAVVTDNGGKLMYAGAQVGTVDYSNGICYLLTNIAGSGGISIVYKPAALVEGITSTHGIAVTAETRAQSYVLTLPTNPMPGSLQVSYAAGGNWYVLTDDGSGKIAGADASTGVGTLNRNTKTVSLTLGALPDVGSMILYVWGRELASDAGVANPGLEFEGKFFIPVNSAGGISTAEGPYFNPGSMSLSWPDGASTITVTDDGAGNLTGGATGRVDYSRGVAYVVPAKLPPRNTLLSLQAAVGNYSHSPVTWTGGGTATLAGLGPAGMSVGTVRIPVTLDFSWLSEYVTSGTVVTSRELVDVERVVAFATDAGNGKLVIAGVEIGTVDNASGTLTISLPGDEADPRTYALMTALGLKATVRKSYNTLNAGVLGWTVTREDAAGLGTRYGKPKVVATATAQVSYIAGGAASALQTIALGKVCLQTEWFSERVRIGGVGFMFGGKRYRADGLGNLITDINPSTGNGTIVGDVGLSTGLVDLNVWTANATNGVAGWSAYQINPVTGAGDLSDESAVYFRTAAAPLRPGSFQVVCTMQDGTEITATANASGQINHARVKGVIDYEAGFGRLIFCNTLDVGFGTYDASALQIPGVSTIFVDAVMASSIRYNAVAYDYIPVDPAIVGVNAVRLPSDGRVPIFIQGNYVKLHTADMLEPQTVTDGQLIDLGVERLSRIVIWDADDIEITYGWARDLDAGKVRILASSGWKQPVRIGWGIEHMALARDVQINGDVTLNLPLTHNFPLGKSYLSSCLMLGDRWARVSLLFDQSAWDGVTYADSVSNNAAAATYNDTAFPIIVDNTGAITERWALHVNTGGASFRVVGERVGVIVQAAPFTVDCAPINPNTGTPYFTIKAGGWGTGWAANNVLRMNTGGAGKGFCVVRAIQPGAYQSLDHRFALQTSVDIDRPAGDGEEA